MRKRAKTGMITSKEDHLSKLPEHIMHKILSLLPLEEAIGTAVLSKAWRDVWVNLPCLNLGKELFDQHLEKKLEAPECEDLFINNSADLVDKLKNQFLDFVDRTLTKRFEQHSKGGSLLLYMPRCRRTNEASSMLDGWINHAINNFHLEELGVCTDFVAPYKLPGKILVGSLPLKRLSLCNVQLDQEMIECLAASCPLMQRLCFDRCVRSHTLKVSGFSKLDELVLHDESYMPIIDIDVPNLGSLDYQVCLGRNLGIQMKVTACVNLRYLRIDGATCSRSPEFVTLLSNVEHLVLVHCRLSGNFVISSNFLKSCIVDCELLGKMMIDAPNLKIFTVDGDLRASSIVINSALKKGIFGLSYAVTAADFFDFLTKVKLINPCEELDLCANWLSQHLSISPYLETASKNLLYGVNHLMLKIPYKSCGWKSYGDWKSFCINQTLDSLLWLCPNPQTISLLLLKVSSKVDELKVIKLKYFKQGEGGAKKCSQCKSLPALCWQHHLQEVSIENTYNKRRRSTRSEEDEIIKSFFDNAKEGEKIVVNIIS